SSRPSSCTSPPSAAPSTCGWSAICSARCAPGINGFTKAATALLPAFSGARPEDWISVDFGRVRVLDRVEVSFTVDAGHSLPSAVRVEVCDGRRRVPVTGARIDWATASGAPTVVTFDAVRGTGLRLTLTSAHPGEAAGAIRVVALEAPAG
ncbi:discoidin domain-containing protein, partial [Streptomyces sp. NPDC096080]|uniref:discoidin domain-containing protein n=1 Tax=Streptomyces sp. NPDC096080 TaxID=3156693 RepID=UPI003319B106